MGIWKRAFPVFHVFNDTPSFLFLKGAIPKQGRRGVSGPAEEVPEKGQDVALEGDGSTCVLSRAVKGRGAVPGDDAEGREKDAPPVVARAVAQDDLEGVVGPGGEEGAVVGPIWEVADAQQELGPVGDARGGQGGLADGQQENTSRKP